MKTGTKSKWLWFSRIWGLLGFGLAVSVLTLARGWPVGLAMLMAALYGIAWGMILAEKNAKGQG
jgi:hypothetical protein